MNLTNDDKEQMRIAFAAVAMHALLSGLRPDASGTLNYNGVFLAQAATLQADQLIAVLERPEQ